MAHTICTHTCSTNPDPVYAVPHHLELEERSMNTPQNERSHRRPEHKEEVEIQYNKPVLSSKVPESTTNARTKKPLFPPNHTSHKTPSNQMKDEKPYQPLIPLKRCMLRSHDTKHYEDLDTETR